MKTKILSKILKSEFVTKSVKVIVENAPKILTGISIVTSVASVGFAVKGTILAVEIEKQRRAKIESGELPVPEHPKLEVVKSVWKCYIPAASFLAVSIGSSLYGTNISTARTAMATAACKASEIAFEEYRTKVEEELGKEKANAIEQSIEKDHAEQCHTKPTTLIVSPYDEYPCKEKFTGQVIRSDINSIREAFNRINYQLSNGYQDHISFAEYCNEFDISNNNDKLGWNVTKTGLLVLRYDLCQDDNGVPMIEFYTSIAPYDNYAYYG